MVMMIDNDGWEREGAKRSVMTIEGATLWPYFRGSVLLNREWRRKKKEIGRGLSYARHVVFKWSRLGRRLGKGVGPACLLGRRRGEAKERGEGTGLVREVWARPSEREKGEVRHWVALGSTRMGRGSGPTLLLLFFFSQSIACYDPIQFWFNFLSFSSNNLFILQICQIPTK